MGHLKVAAFDLSAGGRFCLSGGTGGEGESALVAVQAGLDLIAFGRPALIAKIYGALMQTCEKDRIAEERINEPVDRILNMKRRFRIVEDVTNPTAVGSDCHRSAAGLQWRA